MTSRFDPAKAAEVLALMGEEGLGLYGAAKRAGVARRNVCDWTQTNPEFAKALQEARKLSYDVWSSQIIEIADSVQNSTNPAEVNAARLAVDSRKWLLGKLNPQVYGDRVEVTGKNGKDLLPQTPEVMVPRLMQILAVLLPAAGNSELHGLATQMVGKLNGSPASQLAAMDEDGEDH